MVSFFKNAYAERVEEEAHCSHNKNHSKQQCESLNFSR